jgi:hypothetical protein
MRQVSQALRDALSAGVGVGVLDCWAFDLDRDDVPETRWSSGTTVTFGGETWVGGQVGMQKGKLFAATGTSVDSIEVRLFGDQEIAGFPLVSAGSRLTFNGVRAVLTRIYYATPGAAPTDAVVLFDGYVQRVAPELGALVLEVCSPLALPEKRRGTRSISKNCPFAVYDLDCGVDPAGFTSSATVAAGSTTSQIRLVSLPAVAVPGAQLTFTSGALVSIRVMVRQRVTSPASVVVQGALAVAPAEGDTVSIRRGCNHQPSECRNPFNNMARHGGRPFWSEEFSS